MNETARNISGQGAILPILSGEVLDAVFELRFMIAAMVILTLADLWWAVRELRYHREKALSEGDLLRADLYRYRGSRAGRRTVNKIIDYITYLLVGAFIGYAITEPLGLVSHIHTAAFGLGIGCAFDVSSIIGHVLAVKGISWDGKKMILALVKKKSPDIGEALEEATKEGTSK